MLGQQAHESRPELLALTGLRIFAALLVVMVHFGQSCLPQPLGRIAHAGALGVGLFFVLSGFILTYSYSEYDGHFRGTMRAFYVGRFARIYPVYLVGLAVAILPTTWAPAIAPRLPMPWVAASTLTLTQAWVPTWHFVWNSPGWSLSSEAFFYLIFPFILPGVLQIGRRWLIVAVIASYAAAEIGPLFYHLVHPDPAFVDPLPFWSDVTLFNPLACLPAFLIGMLVGCCYLRVRAAPRWVGGYLFGASAALVLSLWCVAPWLDQTDSSLVVRCGLLLPLFGLLIYCAAWGRGRVARVLAAPALVRLGEASYSVYILHWPIHAWVERAVGISDRAAQTSLAFFLGYLAITIIVSLLIYSSVEVPARRWIRRWGSGAAAKPLAYYAANG